MKYRSLLFLFLLLTGQFLFAQTECPPEGNAKTEEDKELNRQKNRSVLVIPGAQQISLDELLKDGNDSVRFKVTDYVRVSGYVVEVKAGGPESCNCKSKNKKKHDMHIYIGKKSNSEKKDCFIVETTPPYKKAHSANCKKLKGKKVTVTGYLFFDSEHKGNAANTCKKCTKIWRKTAWEIHPVVEIKIEP